MTSLTGMTEKPGAPPRQSPSLSLLGWALNEEDSIVGYVERAERFLSGLTSDFEVILIDDGSTDRTLDIARECAATRPWLRVYSNDRNRGAGYSSKRAIGLATKQYLFWQTVDWAYQIDRMGEMLPALGTTCDVLQGARYGTLSIYGTLFHRSDNAYKGAVSVINYLLIRLLFRLPLSDYQNVTVYPTALIQSVRLETESSFTNGECLLKTWWLGAVFLEVPVPFVKRSKGRGTGTRPKAIVAAVRDIFTWWLRWIVLGQRPDRQRGRVLRMDEVSQAGSSAASSVEIR